MKLIRISKKDSKKVDAEYSEDFKDEIVANAKELYKAKAEAKRTLDRVNGILKSLDYSKLNKDEQRFYKMLRIASDHANTVLFNLGDAWSIALHF